MKIFNRSIFATALVVILIAMSLTSCASNVTPTLQLVVAAAESAVGVLEATGTLPPAIGSQVNTYLSSVSGAVSFSTTELASADTSQVKALKITQEFAKIIAPQLGPGTPQTIIAVIQSVVSAVLNFLNTIQPAVPGPRTANSTPPKQIKVTDGDKKALSDIDARAQRVKSRLARLK